MARSTKNCERELEKVETDATLMDKNPDKYAARSSFRSLTFFKINANQNALMYI